MINTITMYGTNKHLKNLNQTIFSILYKNLTIFEILDLVLTSLAHLNIVTMAHQEKRSYASTFIDVCETEKKIR